MVINDITVSACTVYNITCTVKDLPHQRISKNVGRVGLERQVANWEVTLTGFTVECSHVLEEFPQHGSLSV